MSTPVIDSITTRTSEMLTAFVTKISNNKPADNIFVDLPTWNKFWERKKLHDGGRQERFSVAMQQNSTVQSFAGHQTYDVTAQDSVRPALYAYKNYVDTIVYAWEEKIETANAEVRAFDIIDYRRDNAIKSLKDRCNSDLFVTSPAVGDFNSLPFMISTTGSPGEIDSAANTWWRSQENTTVGAFAANGMTQMRDLWNDIARQGMGRPEFIVTTQATHQSYEAELEADIRYADPKKLQRGASELAYKEGVVITFDNDCPTGQLYMINFDYLYLEIETAAQFKVFEFDKSFNQFSYAAPVAVRGQLVMNNRRAQGRLTGIT